MRLGKAEIGEQPVPHVLGDIAAGPLDLAAARREEVADDVLHVFGIDLGGETGGADEVAEQDSQLAALRGGGGGRGGTHGTNLLLSAGRWTGCPGAA